MEKKFLQQKLQDKISSDFNSLFKTNEYKNVSDLKKNILVDFDYLKSTSVNKIKYLCHFSLDCIQNLIQNFLTVAKHNPLMEAFEKSHLQIQRQIDKLEIDKKNLQETNSNLLKKIKSITPLLEKLKAFNNDLLDDIENIIKENDSQIKKFLVQNVQKFNKDKSVNQRIRNSFKNIENLLTKNLQDNNEQDHIQKHQLMTTASLDILNTFQQYLQLHQNCDVTLRLEGRARSSSPHQDKLTVKKQMIDDEQQHNENSDRFLMPHKYSQSQKQKRETIKQNQFEKPSVNVRASSKKQLLQTTPLKPSVNKKKSTNKKIPQSQTMQLNNNKYELTLRLIKEDKNSQFKSDVKKKKQLVNELKDFTNNLLNITVSSDVEDYLLDKEQIEAIKGIIKKKKQNKDLSQEKLKKKKIQPIQNKAQKKEKQKRENQPTQKNLNKNKTLKTLNKKKPKQKNQNESQVSVSSHKEVTLINYKIDDFLK